MERDADVRPSAALTALEPLRFATLCGNPAMEKLIKLSLEARGFQPDPDADIIVLIDAPPGWALPALERLHHTNRQIIVSTTNLTPEYLLDMQALEPAALLASDQCRQEVDHAIERVARGDRYRIVPDLTSKLSPAHREILRYHARGLTPEQIAQVRGVTRKSVNNLLAQIRDRLDLHTDVALAHYYFGRADLLMPLSNEE